MKSNWCYLLGGTCHHVKGPNACDMEVGVDLVLEDIDLNLVACPWQETEECEFVSPPDHAPRATKVLSWEN